MDTRSKLSLKWISMLDQSWCKGEFRSIEDGEIKTDGGEEVIVRGEGGLFGYKSMINLCPL